MELVRALAVLLDPPTAAHRPVAAALGLGEPPPADEHTDVLVFQVYPYGSVYLGADGMLGGDARDRVAGLWRALGAEPPAEPDHAAALLVGVDQLAAAEAAATTPRQAAAARAARRTLFREHLVSWMPPFLAGLRRTGHRYYRGWADVAEATLVALAAELTPEGGEPGPAAAVDAPGVPRTHLAVVDDPRPGHAAPEDAGELIATLLTPARIGMTLTRDDLLRAGHELGLGCRAGERRFVLRGLLGQDAAAVLGWLADEARRQAAALAGSPLASAAAWRARARAGATWLAARAADAVPRTGAVPVAGAAPAAGAVAVVEAAAAVEAAEAAEAACRAR